MEANPFSTTLHIAVARPRMTKEEFKKRKAELQRRSISIWEAMIDAIRSDMRESGIDLDGVTVEMNQDQTEDADRYFTISGIRSDEVASVRAIFEVYFVVTDEDFDPTEYEEDDTDEPWRQRDEDADNC